MLALAVGGHWVLLQSVAWVRMTVRFSQAASLEEALKMTFDGEHPCALCKAVKQGKQSEQEPQRRTLDKKIDLYCPHHAIEVVQPVKHLPAFAAVKHVSSGREAPPRPPPKAT